MKKTNNIYWKLCCAGVFLLSALTFTPLIMTAGRFEPMLAGIPFTLWATILIGFALLLLTFIGSRVHGGEDYSEEEEQQ